MKELTRRESLFVVEYLKDLNATQAAIRAGFTKKNASARTIGARLYARPDVRAAIDEAQAARAKRTELTADRVLKELEKIGFMDLAAAFDEKGKLLPVHEMPEEVRRAIKSVEVVEATIGRGKKKVAAAATKKVGWSDKTRALELIGKHLGIFKERLEHSGPGGGPIPLKTLTDAEIAARIDVLLARRAKK